MRKINWELLVFILGLIAVGALAVNDIVDYRVGGVSKFKITSAGNTTIAGSLTVAGNTTFTGFPTLPTRTITQINALTPTAINQLVACSDCTRSYICKSSGTTTGAFTVSTESATVTSPTHCS